ncbi:hypothetical protein ACTXG7_27545 [Mycolicibacterium sp. Dal123E01]|uniref:hypothetical protein n=1 Tax=Mycolicibacterium sp. Dal123E01 TaxID=3457578 RepID=UPI00403EC42A
MTDAATRWTANAIMWEDAFTHLSTHITDPGGTPWDGIAAEAAQARAYSDRLIVSGLADQLHDAASIARRGADQIAYIKERVLESVHTAEIAGFSVGEDLSVDSRAAGAARQVAARQAQAQAYANEIRTRVGELIAADQEVAAGMTRATADIGDARFSDGRSDHSIQAVDNRWKQGPQPFTDGDKRRQNQIDAFHKISGRDPVSKSDWMTAASLDPNTYSPKFNGKPSTVEVVRIRPVPGQGVVRSSQWIPQRDVYSWPLGSRDLGNDRGPNPDFDPEDTKVTTTIDYDNGIVVIRQNPSVMENHDGSPGEVRCGTPTGTVTQLQDGTVRVKYDAGNPFAPGITRDPNGPMQGHLVTVNGDLVFTPVADGVHVDGTRTNYPSMEVYQDMPDGSTHTVFIDNAASGSPVGPGMNLPRHHDIGIGGKAFEPFNVGGWNPKLDVPTPLPGTAFGSVDNPPSAAPPAATVGAPM